MSAFLFGVVLMCFIDQVQQKCYCWTAFSVVVGILNGIVWLGTP